MSRCSYLDYESHGFWGNSDDEYICKLCGKHMPVYDAQVKYVCNAEYGDEYKKCPIYKEYS